MQITSERGVITLTGVVPRPVRDVWDIMSDTSRINELVFGLPPVDVKAASADSITAQVKVAGLAVEFEEHPWVYEAPHKYSSLRVFASGPMEKLEAFCELAEVNGGTDVFYRVTITTKSGPVGWAAEKVIVNRTEEGVEKLQKILEHQSATVKTQFRYHDEPDVRAKLAPFAKALADVDPMFPPLVPRLFDALATLPDEEAARMRPYELAEEWGARGADVLALCLHAVKQGVLAMRWDVLCPSCRASLHSMMNASGLHKLGDKTSCPTCAIDDIEVRKESNVEAVFLPSSAVRSASSDAYCLGSPRRTPHWLAQLVLEPGTTHVLQPRLGVGRFRVQSPGIKTRTLVDVGENGETAVRITLEGERGGAPPALPDATPVVQAGQVKMTLKNEDVRRRRVQLVNEGFADLTATAAHVVETNAWQSLFGAVAASAG